MPKYIVSFVKAFLCDRRQFVRVGGAKSNILNCDIGCPRGCVLSPVLFSIYTDFIRSNHSDIKIFKYADDMALVGLLNYKTDHSFYYDAIEHYLEQCRDVNLLINAKKTQEMVLSFSRTYAVYDYLFINNSPIEHVANFKYLGTVFSNDLKWHANTEVLYNKIKSRFYAFSKFKDFKPTSCQKQYFIQSLIVPILFYNIEL